MRNVRWSAVMIAAYLGVVAVTAVITGPTVLRGADGLEIGPLLLLGLPCSLVLMSIVGRALEPFGDTASDWGLLLGLVSGSLVNAVIAGCLSRRRPSPERNRLG